VKASFGIRHIPQVAQDKADAVVAEEAVTWAVVVAVVVGEEVVVVRGGDFISLGSLAHLYFMHAVCTSSLITWLIMEMSGHFLASMDLTLY